MKIFFDANILFMASVPGSANRILLDATQKYAEQCLTNQHILEEARRNIVNKKPDQLPEFIKITDKLIISNAFYSSLKIDLLSQNSPVMVGAIGARCTHLLTANIKYFGKLYRQTIHGVTVVSPAMLADILVDMGWVTGLL